ncbi:sodium/iodide cotransporter-like [Dermacentor silvarum]|uniref:sodium/iodide cotransporter-like n=1 Tax=Dermacentor silvarum TaxID=543639 RepID=UPI002100CA17|nr:sodium/iodide cotransporter-like [Dermacentor silvarum]
MSSVTRLDATECAVFGVLTALGYLVGLYFSFARRRKEVASGESGLVAAELEAFLGGRSLPPTALAVSIMASAVNGMNVVAIVGHYYAYGLHLLWTVAWVPISATLAAVTVVPLLYSLRVSTIFQYLRMRFDNKVGITACIIYFVLSQTLGAIGIYSAAIAISTMLSLPLIYTDIAIGLAGTTYTALATTYATMKEPASRVQTSTKSHLRYIQDVLAL